MVFRCHFFKWALSVTWLSSSSLHGGVELACPFLLEISAYSFSERNDSRDMGRGWGHMPTPSAVVQTLLPRTVAAFLRPDNALSGISGLSIR